MFRASPPTLGDRHRRRRAARRSSRHLRLRAVDVPATRRLRPTGTSLRACVQHIDLDAAKLGESPHRPISSHSSRRHVEFPIAGCDCVKPARPRASHSCRGLRRARVFNGGDCQQSVAGTCVRPPSRVSDLRSPARDRALQQARRRSGRSRTHAARQLARSFLLAPAPFR